MKKKEPAICPPVHLKKPLKRKNRLSDLLTSCLSLQFTCGKQNNLNISLPGSHVGASVFHRAVSSQILELSPDRVNPGLHIKVTVVFTGYLPFTESVITDFTIRNAPWSACCYMKISRIEAFHFGARWTASVSNGFNV